MKAGGFSNSLAVRAGGPARKPRSEREGHARLRGNRIMRSLPGRTMTRSEQLHLLRRWAPLAGAGIFLAVLFAVDRPLYEAIRSFRSPFLDELTRGVSDLRGAGFPIV